jgi:hypothetical protein
MVDLRSASDVRKVMPEAFGAAAGIDPNTITDAAAVAQPPPPADNLNLSQQKVQSLIEACAKKLLGQKIVTLLAPHLVPPGAFQRTKFGPLADLLHAHFNSLVQSAVFLTICEGLGQIPRNVTANTPIVHLDEPGRPAFMMRVRDSVRHLICTQGSFEFTQTRGTSLTDAKTVETAMDATIGGLKDAIPTNSCI